MENIIRDVLEAEFLVDDELCINGCENVRYGHCCQKCHIEQDLKPRTMFHRIHDVSAIINDLYINSLTLRRVY